MNEIIEEYGWSILAVLGAVSVLGGMGLILKTGGAFTEFIAYIVSGIC